MSEQRFWLVSLEYDGEQRFVRDNNLIGEKSLSNQEVVDLLNEQQAKIHRDEISIKTMISNMEKLEKENEQLRIELETHKHPLWSTREAERKVNKLADSLADEVKKNGLLNEEINQLKIENMRFRKGVVLMMNDERYVRKGYKIWDTSSDREVQELNYRSQSDDMCEVLNEKEAIIQRLEKENENLQKQVESSETTMNATSHYNAFLESKITTLEQENEELRKENKDLNDMEWEKFKKKYHLE